MWKIEKFSKSLKSTKFGIIFEKSFLPKNRKISGKKCEKWKNLVFEKFWNYFEKYFLPR